MNTPGFNQVLFDALLIYICNIRGEEVDEIDLANTVEAIVHVLNKEYQPIVKKNSKQIDLEDSIKEIKTSKRNESST